VAELDFDGLAHFLVDPAPMGPDRFRELAELAERNPRAALWVMAYGVEHTYIEAFACVLTLGESPRG
jgi:hypothetical protein